MDDYILRLTPRPLKGAAPPRGVQLTLSPEESGPDEPGEAYVFSSFPYSGALAGARLDQVERISAFYVNGIRLRIAAEPAGDALPFQFTDRRTGDRIFNDTFGYVRFTVELREKDGAEAALSTFPRARPCRTSSSRAASTTTASPSGGRTSSRPRGWTKRPPWPPAP